MSRILEIDGVRPQYRRLLRGPLTLLALVIAVRFALEAAGVARRRPASFRPAWSVRWRSSILGRWRPGCTASRRFRQLALAGVRAERLAWRVDGLWRGRVGSVPSAGKSFRPRGRRAAVSQVVVSRPGAHRRDPLRFGRHDGRDGHSPPPSPLAGHSGAGHHPGRPGHPAVRGGGDECRADDGLGA